MTDTPRHSVSVAAAIFDDSGENVLLIKRRDNGNWEPPGGVLELDETIEDGLRREVREETGADIEIGPLSGVYKNMGQGIVALVFKCRALSRPLSKSAEAAQVRWQPLKALPTLMTPAYEIRVQDALSATLYIRHHDGTFLM